MEQQLALPAYEQVLKAAHTFNLLDARGAISVTERAAYIGRIRNLARAVAQSYLRQPRAAGLPDGAAGLGRRSAGPARAEEGRLSMTTHKNLLVELFVEELPPKALKKLGEAFAAALAERPARRRAWPPPMRRSTAFASPRRLAVHVAGVVAEGGRHGDCGRS